MRTPIWETSPGALAAFLNSTTKVHMADLFTITLSGGAVVRYTSADAAVTVNGIIYGLGPAIRRGKTKLSVGISVDTLDVQMAADATVTINGVALLPLIANGGFDGARLALDRVFAPAPGSAWVGSLGLFQGRVSDIHSSRYEASLTIASDSELLNVMVPRNVYQPGCGNTLFDAACGKSKTSSAVSTTATTGTDTTRTVFGTALTQPTAWFALGWAVGVTGANAGIGRTIKAFTAGSVTSVQPWPQAVASGDTFTLYPGCDKTQDTCGAKFFNLFNFRGHPYVPAPETVI